MAKFGYNEYFKPTPRFFRKLGDALLGVSTFAATFMITMDNKWIAIACLAVGSVGKFLTNFFADEERYSSYNNIKDERDP